MKAEPDSDTGPVGSPCIGVCRVDPTGTACEGCHRTLAEIGAWSSLSDAARRAIRAELPGRRAGATGSDLAG